MKKILPLLSALLMMFGMLSGPVRAETPKQKGPLFVNLTSDDIWRANTALRFSESALQQGHPVTIFLNTEAVRIAATAIPQHRNALNEKTNQEMLSTLIAKGATVLVCPPCLKQVGVDPKSIVPGSRLGNAEVVLSAIFSDQVRVMSW